MTTWLVGGARCVLLAMHTRRLFRCCLPTPVNVSRLKVVPSGRCSKDVSISLLARYHVTFGGGLPVDKCACLVLLYFGHRH